MWNNQLQVAIETCVICGLSCQINLTDPMLPNGWTWIPPIQSDPTYEFYCPNHHSIFALPESIYPLNPKRR